MLELPYCNTAMFQLFLDGLAKEDPDELKIVVLDNGAFHKANSLVVPSNIILEFLPPYSPELNPAEKIWAKCKRAFTNRLFKTLEELSLFIEEAAKTIDIDTVKSTCSFPYIFEEAFWTI